MTDTTRFNRRTVVRTIGGTALAVSLAGCAGDQEPADEPETDPDDDQEAEPLEPPAAVDDYLTDNNATGYDGEMVDATGQESLTVDVGAGDIGFAFAPVAVAVDSGTTVTFEWTGEGGEHNVIAADESDIDIDVEQELIADPDHTAEATFDESGIYLYECTPHVGNGKVGAIVVE